MAVGVDKKKPSKFHAAEHTPGGRGSILVSSTI
ncbi:hypothetical protein Bhyg_02510 [Pseudolycoriella hygida]|uniref:Uncharacterized protein n=1 Tax=Pseudolycoriella hygida TaxID=35572 RepID=A0A9Q0S7U4_9DIPT|nr:hypothetical protein Bhyg_02510 [Pseudolycoriella hygida]